MNTTQLPFEDLTLILEKETEAHEQLLSAASRVNTAIKGSDLAVIERQSASLDEHVLHIEKLEERRRECCGEIASTLGLGRETVKLGALIERAPQTIRERLGSLHASLKTAIEGISRITVANRVLIEEGLQMVQGKIGILMQPAAPYTNYRHQGAKTYSGMPATSIINRTI